MLCLHHSLSKQNNLVFHLLNILIFFVVQNISVKEKLNFLTFEAKKV